MNYYYINGLPDAGTLSCRMGLLRNMLDLICYG